MGNHFDISRCMMTRDNRLEGPNFIDMNQDCVKLNENIIKQERSKSQRTLLDTFDKEDKSKFYRTEPKLHENSNVLS